MKRVMIPAVGAVLFLVACGQQEAVEEPAQPIGTPPLIDRCDDVPEVTTDVRGDGMLGNIDPVFHGVLNTYAAEHADTFGGLWIDREALGVVVMAFTDDPAAHLAELSLRRPSPDDIPAVEPPPDITDDRPIGEWDVPFDVVRVAHTEAALRTAQLAIFEAANDVLPGGVSTGEDVLRNRVSIEPPTPITEEQLARLGEAVGGLEDVPPDLICWSGLLDSEAPDPIRADTSLDVITLPSDDGSYPPDTVVTCQGQTFELGSLRALTPVGEIDPGLQSVLAGWLGNEEGQFWQQDGWVLLHEDEGRAQMATFDGPGWSWVDAEMGANGWIWSGGGSGRPCDVRLPLPDGLGEVEWRVRSTPDPASNRIELRASEMSCASGRPMGERLLAPQVVETDEAVWIAMAVVPQGGDQACPSNPWARLTVELDAPLGEREIRDGLVLGKITTLVTD